MYYFRYETDGKIIAKLHHECQHMDKCVNFTEHVSVTISYKSSLNDLDIALCSPGKTCSYILNGKPKKQKRRAGANIESDVRSWTFKSVHFWGESPQGMWMLVLLGMDSLLCLVSTCIVLGNHQSQFLCFTTLVIYNYASNSVIGNQTSNWQSNRVKKKGFQLLKYPSSKFPGYL